MLPVVTPEEMRELDRLTIEGGTPETVLVERAGRAVAEHARTLLGGTYGRRVVIACGKGNNGADGRVAARVLRAWGVRVVEVDLAAGFDREDRVAVDIARADLFVDAMFGTGFRGSLEGEPAWFAERACDVARVLAVDIPSGVDGLTGEVRGAAVRAHATVTFAYLKPGLLFEPGRAHAGAVTVADIGIRIANRGAVVVSERLAFGMRLTTAADARTAVGRRPVNGHKWNAAVLVVGGSEGMIGAPRLAARAALRAGSGMVVAAVPGGEAAARIGGGEVVAHALAASGAGALTADAAKELLGAYVERFKALAIGPGLGRAAETAKAVARLIAEAPIPIVVDADALNVLADDPEPLEARGDRPTAVLTPHDGEYARLAGHPPGADRVGAAWDLASRLHAVVLLKGPSTVIAAPDGRIAINPTGTPALATAGTGDVLTGIVAALLARGAPPFEAAAAAAYIHGRAAEVAGTAPGLVAGDVIEALPRTLRTLTDTDED